MFLLGAVACAVICVCTIRTIFILTSSIAQTKKSGIPQIYEDKDGAATPESTAEFSAKVPKIIVGLLSFSGLGVSSAIAVLGTIDGKDVFFLENWLNAASWVCMSLL